MKKKIMRVFLAPVLASVFGCNGISVDTGSGESSPVAGEERPRFSPEDYGVLYGTFYGEGWKAEVSAESLTLTDSKGAETVYQVEDVSLGEDGIPVATYSDASQASYRLFLSEGEGRLVTFEGATGTVSYSFMPGIAELTGVYNLSSAQADGSTVRYFLGENYAYEKDAFRVGFSFPAAQFTSARVAKTSFVEKGGALVKSLTILNPEDSSVDFQGYVQDGGGSLELVSEDGSATFYSTSTMFSGKFFGGEGDLLDFTYDDAGNLALGGEAIQVSMDYDEKGYSYDFQRGGAPVKIRPTSSGFFWESEGGEIKPYAFDNLAEMDGSYEGEGLSISFSATEGKASVDGVETPASFVLYNGRKALRVDRGGKSYTFLPDIYKKSILGWDGVAPFRLLNKAGFSDLYAKSFVSYVNGVKSVLDFDANFRLIYDGGDLIQGELSFPYGQPNPSVLFSMNGKQYDFQVGLDGIDYVLKSGDEKIHFFDAAVVDPAFNNEGFTSDSTLAFTLSNSSGTVEVAGKSIAFSLAPFTRSLTETIRPSFTYQEDGTWYALVLSEAGSLAKYDIFKGNKKVGSYIPMTDFASLVGEYRFRGKFGVETVKMTADGKLTADTLRQDGSGLDKDVPYSYELEQAPYEGQAVPVIAILYRGAQVFFYKVGQSYVAFGNKYVNSGLFDYQGFYADGAQAHSLFIYRDKVAVDGSFGDIESVDASKATIRLTDGTTISFDQAKVATVTKGSTTYDKMTADATTSLNAFVGSYPASGPSEVEFLEVTDSVTGEVTYQAKVGGNAQDFVMALRNKRPAIKIEAGGKIYYLAMGPDGKVALEVEDSLPPVPPPPSF